MVVIKNNQSGFIVSSIRRFWRSQWVFGLTDLTNVSKKRELDEFNQHG